MQNCRKPFQPFWVELPKFFKYKIVILLAFLIVFSSCQDLFKRKLTILEVSKDLPKNKYSLNLKVAKKHLNVSFLLKKIKPATLPVLDGKVLNLTNFTIEFSAGDSILKNDSCLDKEQIGQGKEKGLCVFEIKGYDLLSEAPLKLTIPLIFFHSIKTGNTNLKVHIYQNYFYSYNSINQADSLNKIKFVKKSMFFLKANYSFNMPSVLLSEFDFLGFEIVDSKGMDFSLIQKGNADLYWQLNFPENVVYYKSDIYKNSDDLFEPKQIKIYHLSDQDVLGIKIFDYDYLTRDDLIAQWNLKIAHLYTEGGKAKELSDDKVKWFRLIARNKGCVNK